MTLIKIEHLGMCGRGLVDTKSGDRSPRPGWGELARSSSRPSVAVGVAVGEQALGRHG
jgi:hypothetical protein